MERRKGQEMLRRLYDWTLELAEKPFAIWALAAVAFAESSFFAIPPDVMLIPMILAAPHRAFRIAAVCTIASVLGGWFGYWIGSALYETVGLRIIEFYHMADKFEAFKVTFNEYGSWAVLFAGVTPFPYKVITITSGVTGLDFWVFTIASIVARGLRFFIVAALLWRFGAPIRDFIDRRLGLLTFLFFFLLFGGFLAVKYL
jgi:membrane protein YqaA with SNARE-associated domain